MIRSPRRANCGRRSTRFLLPIRIARGCLPPKHGQAIQPVRFFVMMGAPEFVLCGVTALYTHRAAHGRTADERAAYAIGEKAGEQAPAGAKLPTDADLNMSQKHFKQQGSGEQQSWDLVFENGYTDGFKKTHHRQRLAR